MREILDHFTHWEKLYSGIGELATSVAVIIGVFALFFSWAAIKEARNALVFSQESLKQQIEWQQRVSEKQMYYQIVQSEWLQELEDWREAKKNQQHGTPPAVKAPLPLREKLIAAGVLKREK